MGMRQAAMRELAKRELAKREQSKQGAPNIIEEMHEGISTADRAIVKNLSSSPEKSANYLKKHNPQLDTRVWDGRVLVKGKNETDWKVLDPDTGIFSKDILHDLGDIGYDVASGIGEGLAFAGTGILGSAAVGAGSEALRQGLGSAAGIEDNMDLGDIALSGAIAGAVPAAGKALKPAIAKATGAGKKFVSGLTEATVDDVGVFAKQGDELDNILNSESGFTDAYQGIIKEVAEKEKIFKDQIQQQFAELRKSGVEVDITNAVKVYDDNLARLSAIAENGSDSDKALLAAMKKERDELFARTMDTKEVVTKYTDFSKNPSSGVDDNLAVKDGGLHLVSDDVPAPPKGVSKTSVDTVVDDGTNLTDQLMGKIPSREAVQDIAKNQDIDYVMNLRQKLAARANFKNKSDLQKSLDSAAMSEGLAARGYGELGTAIDEVANKIGSKEARAQFQSHIKFVGDIAKNFKSVDSVESFMKAATKGNRKVVAERLLAIDKQFGTNLAEKSKVISTAQALKGQDSKNVVDLVRPKSMLEVIGAATGAKMAWAMGQPSLIPITMAAGASVGRKFGSMKAARKYVDFIVDAESKALGIEKKAQEVLKKQLYKSVTGETVLRETVKGAMKMRENRG